jgi:hypothetical protein
MTLRSGLHIVSGPTRKQILDCIMRKPFEHGFVLGIKFEDGDFRMVWADAIEFPSEEDDPYVIVTFVPVSKGGTIVARYDTAKRLGYVLTYTAER